MRVHLFSSKLFCVIGLFVGGLLFNACQNSAWSEERALKPLISGLIKTYGTGLENLAMQANRHAEALEQMCESPSDLSLKHARATFRDLSMAHAQINVIYFGPIRTNNRLERLLFWPDPRGRGLKQISAALAAFDPTVTTAQALKQKSVALQGLGVQDYLLFGRNAESLSDVSRPPEARHRCVFGLSSARIIADIAHKLSSEWTDLDGKGGKRGGAYGSRLQDAHDADPVYKTHSEVLQKFLSSLAESLQIISDQKLRAVLKDHPEKARPKRAPLWRSEMTIDHMRRTLIGVETLLSPEIWADLSNQKAQYALRLIRTELNLAQTSLNTVRPSEWLNVSKNTHTHAQLIALTYGLSNTRTLITDQLMPALNLTVGFNSLDGD